MPPRPGDEAHSGFADSGEHDQPLLDFGDARDDSFFPGLKAASVDSLVPFGANAGRPLKRLVDAGIAKSFQVSGWSGPRVPAPLVGVSGGFSLHAATLIRKGQRAQLEKLCRYVTRPAICLERLDVRAEERRDEVRKLTGDSPVYICDVRDEESIQALGESIHSEHETIHGFVHSIAFANYTDGWKPFHETRKDDFLEATGVSAFPLVQVANALKPSFADDASVVTISISTTTMAAENYGNMAPSRRRWTRAWFSSPSHSVRSVTCASTASARACSRRVPRRASHAT